MAFPPTVFMATMYITFCTGIIENLFLLLLEPQGPNGQSGVHKVGVISNLVELPLCTLGVPLTGIGVRLGGTLQARSPESPNNSRKTSKAFYGFSFPE